MVYSTRRFVVCLSVCHFVLVFFSPFSIAITSLGEERATLSAFRTFVRFVLFRFVGFLFLLGSGKGCGLWLWHSLDFSLTFFARCHQRNVSAKLYFLILEGTFKAVILVNTARPLEEALNSRFNRKLHKKIWNLLSSFRGNLTIPIYGITCNYAMKTSTST